LFFLSSSVVFVSISWAKMPFFRFSQTPKARTGSFLCQGGPPLGALTKKSCPVLALRVLREAEEGEDFVMVSSTQLAHLALRVERECSFSACVALADALGLDLSKRDGVFSLKFWDVPGRNCFVSLEEVISVLLSEVDLELRP
jgi:hypothetical protein